MCTTCNAVLTAHGPYNVYIQKGGSHAHEQTYEFLKTATWQEFSSRQNAGFKFKLPFEDIPIEADGTYSKDSFDRFVEKRESGLFKSASMEDFYESIEYTASPELAKAWMNVVISLHGGPGLRLLVDEDDRMENGYIQVTASYHTDRHPAPPPPTVQTLTVTNGTVITPNPLAQGSKVQYGGVTVVIQRTGNSAVTITLNTEDAGSKTAMSPAVEAPPRLQLRLFTDKSQQANHPSVTVTVDQGYKVIGGGALVNWHGFGNLLIESYPNGHTWKAKGKDHRQADVSTITGYAIGLYDPKDQWEVRIEKATVNVPAYALATARAQLPVGYVLTSGGFIAGPEGPGRLVTASYPFDNRTWEVTAKDHIDATHGDVTAYIIGIKPRSGLLPRQEIKPVTAPSAAHPTAEIRFDSKMFVTGGGGWTNCPNGNLLTGSYPLDQTTWMVEAKDHEDSCPSVLNAFGIALDLPPGSVISGDGNSALNIASFTGRLAISNASAPAFRDSGNQGTSFRQYITSAGDTISRIATEFYGSTENPIVEKIFAANPQLKENPTKISPNTILNLP